MAGQLLPWIDSGDAEGNRNSMQNFLSDGVTTSYDFNFAGGYIDVSHVKAYIYHTESGITEAIDPVVLTGPNTIQVIPAVPLGDYLVVYRDTPKDQPLVDYTTGSVLDEANLDKANQQAVFATAEMADRFDAINASSADAIERSFLALTTAQAADAKSDTAIADSAAAVITADAAEVTAANALQVAEDAVAAATGFQTNLEFYTGDDVTSRGADWQTGSVASPGNRRWFAGTDTASDFTIDRYNDAGVLQGSAVKVDRQTGNVTLESQLDMTSSKIVNVTDGTAASDAATVGQVDTQKIDKDGTLDFAAHQKLFNSTPTDPLHAASKGYVDAQNLLYGSDDSEMVINPFGLIRTQSTAAQTTSGAYFADQWRLVIGGSGFTVEASVVEGLLSLFDPAQMYLKVNSAKASLASTDAILITQPIEGVFARKLRYGSANARGSWLRFRANVSGHAGGTIGVSVRNWANNRSFVAPVTITPTATDYYIFVPGDTTGTWPTGEVGSADVGFSIGAGSTYVAPSDNVWNAGNYVAPATQTNFVATAGAQVNITDVSWRGSNVLLPFQPENYDAALRRAQRYFQFIPSDGITLFNQSSGTALLNLWLSARMRAGPSLAQAPSGYILENSLTSVSSILLDRSNPDFVMPGFFGSGGPGTGTSGRLVAGNGWMLSSRMT